MTQSLIHPFILKMTLQLQTKVLPLQKEPMNMINPLENMVGIKFC